MKKSERENQERNNDKQKQERGGRSEQKRGIIK